MNKIYKVIWSKVRNCYVAVSEIAKRNGKSCTSVNCGAKANRGHAGMALAIALCVTGGVFLSPQVARAADQPVVSTTTINENKSDDEYMIDAENIVFTVGTTGKVKTIRPRYSPNNNTIIINSGGEVTGSRDSFGLSVSIEGGTDNNSITTSGTIAGTIAGGLTAHSNEKGNSVTVNGGIINGDVYGTYALGFAESGKGSVSLNSGTVKGNIFGAYAENWYVLNSSVTIAGGTAEKNVYGGYVGGVGEADATNNTVTITGGAVNGEVYGGYAKGKSIAGGDTEQKGNRVTISGGTVSGSVYGGYSYEGSGARYNQVTVNGNGSTNAVYGGCGYYGSGNIEDNRVTVDTNGTVGNITGGTSTSGSAINGNQVIITGGNINGTNILGGNSTTGNVTNNSVTIAGGSFNTNASSVNIYGGRIQSGTGSSITNNTINLYGTVTGLNKANLYGASYSNNNTTENELHIGGIKSGLILAETVPNASPWIGTTGNKVTSVNNFNKIVLHKVDWSTTTPVLAAGSFNNNFASDGYLDIMGSNLLTADNLGYGRKALLASDTDNNFRSMRVKYKSGIINTLYFSGNNIYLSEVVRAGTVLGNTNNSKGVTLTYNAKEHVVTLDPANSYRNVLYYICDNVKGVSFGEMTWGTGRDLSQETNNQYYFCGDNNARPTIDASNLSFAGTVTDTGSTPSIKANTEMTLLANATGITTKNSITQPGTGKGKVQFNYNNAFLGVPIDATATGTVYVSGSDVKYKVNAVTVDKVTLGSSGALTWGSSSSFGWDDYGWSPTSSTVIDATGVTYNERGSSISSALKVNDKTSIFTAPGLSLVTADHILMPSTNNKVTVPFRAYVDTSTSNPITLNATAYGDIIIENNTVKTKITSISLDNVTLGTYSWGATQNMPETWTASDSTTIDDTNFAYTGNANTKLKKNDTAVILNATGLTTANLVTLGANANKTVGMNFIDNGENGSGFNFVGTVNGHVEAAADKVNYVVDSVTLNNINLAAWTGTAYNIASADGWVLSKDAQNKVDAVVNTSDFSLPGSMTLATGEQKVIISADDAGYFENIKLTGVNVWNGSPEGSTLDSTAVNGVAVIGNQTKGGIKVNEANTSQIIYESSKKNVTGITLGTVPEFKYDGTAARTFDNEHDVSNATINATGFSFEDTSPMEAGDVMTIIDATNALTYAASGQTLKDFDTVTFSNVAFTDTITDPTNSSTTDTIAFAGKHTDTLALNEESTGVKAKTKLIYSVGDKVVETATLSGPITWSDGRTYYTNGTAPNQKNRNSVFTFNDSTTFDISRVKFSTTDDPLAGATKTMTLIGGKTINSVAKNVAGTISYGTPASFDVSLTKNNTLLAASASGSAAIDSGDLKFTVTGVTIDKINVTSITGDADTVPTGWTLAKDADDKVIATVETDELSVSDPSGLKPGETKVIIEAAAGSTDYFKDVTVNGGYAWKADGSNITSDLDIGGVAITGTQTKGGVKVNEANTNQIIYEESKKIVKGITLGEVTFAKDGTARAFDNTYDATGATINGDNLKFTEASAASMETGDTMTILDASAAFKSGGAALVEFADKSYTVAFSETNTDQNVTIAGTHSDTLSQDAAKTKLTYTVGTKDVNTVALGKVDFVKGSTLFDRSGAGYNYAGVAALGTDGFAVSYASPETVATGDSMTLLQANATLKDMAEQVKQTSYSFAPVSGVTVDAAITGSLEAKGGNVTYTATANQASKLTFTSVDWKDSGALMTRPSNITFAGADVDTAKIHFKNVKELDANRKMTLVSDFGDSVGTITGTKYTVGAGLEGEGAASLSGSDLIFTTKTGARDLAALAQTHNTLMVMEAGMAVLAAGREHLGQAMVGLADPQNAGSDGTRIGASMGGGWSRYKTGSHVDSNNWNVAVAVGSKRELKKGSLEWGVFGEYGKSNYTLHSDAGRGDGDSHYAGGGLMAKWTNKHDVYTEASVRLGRLNDTASNLLRDAAGNGYGYDVHANYFGAHVGIGKIIRYKGGKSLDVYGKYFYTKRDGVDFASGGNNYSLDSVASNILRVGARYGTTDKKWNWYGGLAYEYEFDGKSEGTVDGVGIRAASIKGGSVRGEIGLRMSATKTNPWQTDISIYGYGGKHRGFGGSVNVAYMF